MASIEKMFSNGLVLSVENSSTDNPFFMSSTTDTTSYTNVNNKITDKDKEIFDLLPFELRILYSRVGSNCEYRHKSGLTFLKLDEIKRRSISHTHFIDVAIAYMGMGWIRVLSYHKDSKLYFIRIDGGSNEYDREYNYHKYKDYVPTVFELKSLEKILVNFSRRYKNLHG